MSPSEIEIHAGRLLKSTEKLVASRVHPKAVEHTGIALFRALKTYDGARGTVDAWVAFKVPRIVRDILRNDLGREGSMKKDFRQKTQIISDTVSGGSFDNSLEKTEESDRILKITSQAPREIKRLLAARLVADPPLRDSDLCRILNLDPVSIRRQAAGLPGFLRGVRPC